MFNTGAAGKVGIGIAFLVGAATVAEFIAKCVSSPQTVFLNAKRAPTILQWVHVGQIEAAAFIVIAAIIDPKFAKAFIGGAALEMAITEAEYVYARNRGVKDQSMGTEHY